MRLLKKRRAFHVGMLIVGALAVGFSPVSWAGPTDKKPTNKKKSEDTASQKKKKKKRPSPGFKVGPRETAHYEIAADAQDNKVSFISKASRETFEGKTTQIAGTLDLNPHVLKEAKGKFTVQWNSLDTGQPKRNEHMMASPWVDASSHPEIVFTMDAIEKCKAIDKRVTRLKCVLVGGFALNGAEKKMHIPATIEYVLPPKGATKPRTNGDDAEAEGRPTVEGIHIEASFSLGLKDFGIKGMGIGEKVAARQQIKVSVFVPRVAQEETMPPAKPDGGLRPRRPGRIPRT